MEKKVVEIMFAKNVPAYARTTAQMPAEQSLEDFLKECSGDLMGDLVFQPDWQQASGERVVDATSSGESIQGLVLEGQDDFDVAETARKVLHQHWDQLAEALPNEVLADLHLILGGQKTQTPNALTSNDSLILAGLAGMLSARKSKVDALRQEIELKLQEFRALITDPVEIAYGDQVSIEIRPEGEGDAVLVSRKDWGYTLVNYGQASLKATIYDGSPAIDPVHEVEIDYVDLLDETVGLAASFPAE